MEGYMLFFNRNKKSKEQQIEEARPYLHLYWSEYTKKNKHVEFMMLLHNTFCPYYSFSQSSRYLTNRLSDNKSIFERDYYYIKNKDKAEGFVSEIYQRYTKSKFSPNETDQEEKVRINNVLSSIDTLFKYMKMMKKEGIKLSYYEIIQILMHFDIETRKKTIINTVNEEYGSRIRKIYELVSGFKRFDANKFSEYKDKINLSHIIIAHIDSMYNISYSLVDIERYQLVTLIKKVEKDLKCSCLSEQINKYSNRKLIDIMNAHVNYLLFSDFLQKEHVTFLSNLNLYKFLDYYFEFSYSHNENEPRSKKLLKSYSKIMSSNNISPSYNELEHKNEIQQKVKEEISKFNYVLKNINSESNSSLIEHLDSMELDFDICMDYYYKYCIINNNQSHTKDSSFVQVESSPGRNLSATVKREVWRRDQGKCVECGSKEFLEFDHIVPFSRGGSNTTRNIQLLCGKCNKAKSNNIS